MRQKKILMVLALSLFVFSLTDAYADDFFWVQLNSVNNDFDGNYFPNPDIVGMGASAGTQSPSSKVYVQFNTTTNPVRYDPSRINYQLNSLPQWSALMPPWNIYSRSFYPIPPAPPYSSWETINAFFFIDTGTPGYDPSDPSRFILPRPPGTYHFLSAPSNVQIAGGIYPTITWDLVPDAENYRLGIIGINPDGTANLNDLKFIVSSLTTNSYTYTGDLFKSGDPFGIFVEARDYLQNNVNNAIVNQSRFITEYSAPVPEPTSMLLLGSGLIGLAGYGRKKLFKK